MHLSRILGVPALAAACCFVTAARGDDSAAEIAKKINPKLVKVYGSGGYKGLPAYGTGFLVSADGYILTAANHLLDTQDLRVHLFDGARYHAKVVATEPLLDVALIKIGDEKYKVDDLPFFDLTEAIKRGTAENGTNVLGFSNQFQIASRDEPMSIQRGTISAFSALPLSRGTSQALFSGNVYVIDAITNNPGAAGGVITTRKGELLGIIGKELRNDLTNTWVNYAIPVGSVVKSKDEKGQDQLVSVLDLLDKKETYKPVLRPDKEKKGGGYTGIVLVPNVVDRTPPYIEEVLPNSPAAKANLKPDDLIVYLDGLPVVSINVLRDLLGNYQPGDEVQVEIRRGDKLETVKVKLEPFPKKEPPKK